MKYDVLVVGAGFAGSTVAEQLASNGKSVLVIDKRSHIAGNAYDYADDSKILVHAYGPHIFHTKSKRIFVYLSQFTDWLPYEHRVKAKVGEKLLPIPINQTTINQLYDLDLDEQGVTNYLEEVRIPTDMIRTSEDVVLNSVGHDLCEKFFRGYTRKQWGLDLSELSAGVAARIPVRNNRDDRYFTDEYQMMPLRGYTAMFEKMLSHPNIELLLGTEYQAVRDSCEFKHVVYTGPIDEYFDNQFGKLPYRSLRFEHEHLAKCDKYQEVGTINYPNDFEYTRITEFKHLTGQQQRGTSIIREYPQTDGDPYYPVPRKENEATYKRYQDLANNENHVSFVGRLAQYRYYNMDQVVASALEAASKIINEWQNK